MDGRHIFQGIFFKELENINYHIEQCKEDSTQTLWSMFCKWKFAFKYFNVNCIYWWVVNLSMHFISVSLEYFVCFCDKYFYFILNEYFFSIGHYLYPKLVVCGRCICDKYFFSICHYLWKVHPLCLYPKLVGCGQVWEADYGIKSIEYFVCICDGYLYFILNEYFFSICHYLYPKLVGCGQVWEADCGIMRRSALATLEAPNKCTCFYSFYFMNLVIYLFLHLFLWNPHRQPWRPHT